MTGVIAARMQNTAFGLVGALCAFWAWLNTVHAGSPMHPEDPGLGVDIVALSLAILFATVGGLILRRYPRNAVGWIFVALGLLYSVGMALGDYVWLSHSRDAGWPLTTAAAYLVDVTFQSPASFGLFVFFFLLFPDGRLPSYRWRWLAYLGLASIAGLWINGAFRADLLVPIPIQNPLGVEAMDPIREALDMGSFGGLVVSLVGSVTSLIVRLRRSRGEERLQIKWFLTAAAVLTTTIALAPFTFFRPGVPQWMWAVALLGSLSLIPIAAGVAILKYRLYEIDVIINRALVYGALTGILAVTYLGCVVVLQALLEPITRESDLAVAASTLAVAALFQPLRRRVQAFIDQSFYRRRYDAASTLEAFSARLRDEVDLASLADEVMALVGMTMQPAHASIWLRPAEERARS